MGDLRQKHCVPCETGTPRVTGPALQGFLSGLPVPWNVVHEKQIVREFTFKDFKEAMTFVNRVAAIAEDEGHHPDIHISYNKVRVTLWTHAIGGLSENDFILAAKIEKL